MADVLAVVGAVGGIVGGAGAVWAAIVAQGARGHSSTSAAAAADSAESARGTLDVMRAEAARAVERSDVDWRREQDKHRRGAITLRNVGSTTAYAVAVVLTINGDRISLAPGDVPAGGVVEYDATDVYRAASAAASSAMARQRAVGTFYAATPKFRVTSRITWESELGTPAVAVFGFEGPNQNAETAVGPDGPFGQGGKAPRLQGKA